MNEKWQVKTLEGRLSDKFDLLLIAREESNANAFDEFAKSIETLLLAVPEASKKLQEEKAQMVRELEQQYNDIIRRMENAQDSISRDTIGNQLTNEVDWAFRDEYSELLMEIFYEYNLVPMQFLEKTIVEPEVKSSIVEDEPKETEQKQKKPKLLNQTKRKTGFSV
jgi:hypothetical protein